MNTEERRKLLSRMINKRREIKQDEEVAIEHVEKNIYQLSEIQRGIFIDCKLDPDSYVYNIPFACKINGHLEIEILKDCLKRIIERHDIWRTVFKIINEVAYQEVYQEAIVDFNFIDLMASKVDENVVRELAKNFVSRSFDLEKGPLVRFALYQVAK